MATTGRVNATIVKLKTGGTPTELTHTIECSLEVTREVIKFLSKSSAGFADYIAGEGGWTMSGKGYFQFDAANGFEELFTAWQAGTAVSVVFTTAVSGDMQFSGSTIITSLSTSAGTEGSMEYDVTFQGSGAIIKADVGA